MAEAVDGEAVAARLVDLRALAPERRARLLGAFDRELYRPAFPDDDIREDPSVWLEAMAEAPAPPIPVVAPILALDEDERVLGGVVVERYREANAGFLTYLLVAPSMRRTGLGRRLAEAAIGLLRAEAPKDSPPLLFAEAERPELIDEPAEKRAAVERLAILSSLGALVGDLDYVQPPLAPGLAPHRLFLLAAAETLPADGVAPGARVLAFLSELYRALGCDPARDANFAAMAAAIEKSKGVRFRSP